MVPAEPETARASLVPEPTVQKFLISVPCHMTGRFLHDALLIADAQPTLANQTQRMRMSAETSSRTAMALVFRTDPAEQGKVIIPQYDSAAEAICSFLSLLYGKRFDSHGPVENSGFFYLPNLRALDIDHDGRLPQNGNRRRADFGFALDLQEVSRVMPLIFSRLIASAVAVRSAAKFYHQALLAVEQDVEIAYLHLITAGEILSGAIDLEPSCLVDAETRQLLTRIESDMPDGAAIARSVRSKLRSIKRRFVAGLGSLIEPAFFEVGEAAHGYARFDAAGMTRRLAAAYDLRSRYVHTGKAFGDWVGPRGTDREEIQIGKPDLYDKEYARVLAAAPTYIGLERIIRYCLLRHLEGLGLDLRSQSESAVGEERAAIGD